jgi:hypothetical protein
MFGFSGEDFIPFLVFSIPIIAIVGGISAGIVKTLGRQRLIELAQQERIAAIQRGLDITKLPPLPSLGLDDEDMMGRISGPDRDRRRAQGLLIAGIITLAVSSGLIVFFTLIEPGNSTWAVGIIPAAAGVALLLSAWIVQPKGSMPGPGAGPQG